MPVSRRTFLGLVAGAWMGLGARARADLKEFNRRRIDRAEERFGVPVHDCGYLDEPAFAIDDCVRGPQAPYVPQAGDIMFSHSEHWIYRAGHRIAGAGEPSHSGIVWQRPDGTFAVLEAGLFDIPLIRSMELIGHLGAYHGRGHVWLRTRSCPLAPEQICRLAEFAAKQEDKPFARLRLVGQITPFRSRGLVRTRFLGRPRGPDRLSYFCAELVAEALVHIGSVAAEDARPSATYPIDLFFEDSRVPFLKRNFKLAPGWEVPQRWRPCLEPCRPK